MKMYIDQVYVTTAAFLAMISALTICMCRLVEVQLYMSVCMYVCGKKIYNILCNN